MSAAADVGAVFIGGSPNFEMVDDKREAMNREVLASLATSADSCAAIDLLAGMGGKIFNLANTVPEELETDVKAACTAAVIAAAASIEAEPNRSLAQGLLDVAGPPPEEVQAAGMMNCNALANGWLYSNVISERAQEMVKAVYERQWGPPRPGCCKDK
eukprot:TRINITY_DN7078_c0_g1_i1.p1 TRINITY_DN7078_c0_g1~~TRINITY_DN7078_c0_g1_i1.p1  ORF type:complete len:158 (+),score=26.43 TRINITY_DN7078_c0_g1_i1:70-543(+)